MTPLIQKRNPFIRFLLLAGIVGLVTIAFWLNSERQLSLIVANTYILHSQDFLTQKQEQAYIDILQKFSSDLGIQTKLIFEETEEQSRYEQNTLFFIISPLLKKGYIIYPTLVQKIFSEQEQKTLHTQLSQILLDKEWKNKLLYFIEDVYTLLSSSIK